MFESSIIIDDFSVSFCDKLNLKIIYIVANLFEVIQFIYLSSRIKSKMF